MSKSSLGCRTRKSIEGTVISQCDCLGIEKQEAGAKSRTLARGSRLNADCAVTCVLCLRSGHNAALCRQDWVVQRDPKDNRRLANGKGNRRRGVGGGGRSSHGNGGRRKCGASNAERSGPTSDDAKRNTDRSELFFQQDGTTQGVRAPESPEYLLDVEGQQCQAWRDVR